MKSLAAIIFCTGVIMLVFLSGASKGKQDAYLQTLADVEIFASVECMETCVDKQLVTVIPLNQKVKILLRVKGRTAQAARVEYQGQSGWFTVTDSNAKLLQAENLQESKDAK